jgi:hypothetical protein
MGTNRDEFSPKVRDTLAKRASYICSNPDCRLVTVAASAADPNKFLYVGKAAHITAAAPEGPRYDASLTSEDRSDASNGIFLCAACADLIDRNGGADFDVPILRSWKSAHESWTRENLNKKTTSLLTTIDGVHAASGVGRVTGLDLQGPATIKPGTVVTAEGVGEVTATRVGPPKEREK